MYSRLRHAAGRIRRSLIHGTGSPDAGRGAEAGPDTYDAVFAASAEYARPWAQSRYYFLWCVLVDRLRAADARRVLEVGCGPGQFATMAFALGVVDEYLGLDFSPTGVAIARSSCPKGRFEVADARTTHWYSEFDADVFVCTEVLEHIEADLDVIERWPAGRRCLCTVPNFPYETHVRHFADEDEVRARYGRYFRDFSVTTWPDPRDADALKYFLFEGVKGAASGPPSQAINHDDRLDT